MYANHQGKYDALGIMLAHPKPCAMLWEEKSADRLVARQVCGLVEGTTISFEDPKQQIGALKTIAERVKDGKPYLIFPEAVIRIIKMSYRNLSPGVSRVR